MRVRRSVGVLGIVTLLGLLILIGDVLYQQRSIETSVKAIQGRVVVIDPGHGGRDPGTVGAKGTLEKEVVLAIAHHLKKLLEGAGARVIMIRETDTDLADRNAEIIEGTRKRRDLTMRAKIANDSGADIFVSIHANATPSPRWSGAQTFYNPTMGPDSQRLAMLIQQELIRLTGHTRRLPNEHLEQYLLYAVKMPAVNVEVGFLSNPTEEELLASPSYQQQVAWAIFVGIARYFVSDARPVSAAAH